MPHQELKNEALIGGSELNAGLGLPRPDTCVDNIVRDWLKLNGFDGLVHEDTECGCHLEDLFICQECFNECRPAYKFTKANGDWWMSTNKHWQESAEGDEA